MYGNPARMRESGAPHAGDVLVLSVVACVLRLYVRYVYFMISIYYRSSSFMNFGFASLLKCIYNPQINIRSAFEVLGPQQKELGNKYMYTNLYIHIFIYFLFLSVYILKSMSSYVPQIPIHHSPFSGSHYVQYMHLSV